MTGLPLTSFVSVYTKDATCIDGETFFFFLVFLRVMLRQSKLFNHLFTRCFRGH